jgi:hypothetical protein
MKMRAGLYCFTLGFMDELSGNGNEPFGSIQTGNLLTS